MGIFNIAAHGVVQSCVVDVVPNLELSGYMLDRSQQCLDLFMSKGEKGDTPGTTRLALADHGHRTRPVNHPLILTEGHRSAFRLHRAPTRMFLVREGSGCLPATWQHTAPDRQAPSC